MERLPALNPQPYDHESWTLTTVLYPFLSEKLSSSYKYKNKIIDNFNIHWNCIKKDTLIHYMSKYCPLFLIQLLLKSEDFKMKLHILMEFMSLSDRSMCGIGLLKKNLRLQKKLTLKIGKPWNWCNINHEQMLKVKWYTNLWEVEIN